MLIINAFSQNNTINKYSWGYDNALETRINSLMSKLTIKEKVELLVHGGDTSRMGDVSCGLLGFMNNALTPKLAAQQYYYLAKYMKTKTKYGIVALREAEGIFAYMGNGGTAFPQPLAQAAAWDTDIVASVAGVVGAEMASRGVNLVLSPVLNMGRDPRWGRTGETYGEDPYLVSRMGVSYIKTIQNLGMATTIKHFAGNTGHDGKFGAAVFYSERYYREFEFPPYEAAIKEGKAQAVMMAYNTGDAIPFVYNEWMMKKYLKGELGFDGIIFSDGGGLKLVKEAYGVDTSYEQIAARCINAGCDLGLDDAKYYREGLLKANEMGLVSEATINDAVRRMLRVMLRSGASDDPLPDPNYAEKINDCEAHRKIALEVSKKCMVLLKNDKNTLPFSKNIKNILVAGPLANKLLVNHYGGWGRKEVTVLEGVKNLLPNANVKYVKGAEVGYAYYPTIPNSVFYYEKDGKLVQGLLAEYYTNKDLAGTPKMVQTDPNIDFDWALGAPTGFEPDNFSVKWKGKFKAPFTGMYQFGVHADDGLTLYINDMMMIDMRYGPKNFIFVDRCEIYLEKGKEYSIQAEFRENGGKAFCKLGWNADLYAQIPEAVSAASQSDAIIVVVGMFDNENGDRAMLNLDPAQEKLIAALAATGKPIVVVLQTGTVLTMRNWIYNVPAVLMAWYPGEEGGNAIAQTIFGDNNPSGKLPITIPKETGQVPLTYNSFPGKDTRPVDRGLDEFFDVGNAPLYPFGYGLSYTTYSYANFKVSKSLFSINDSISFTFDLTNTGKVTGDEITQLYAHDLYASISRPLKELKSYKKTTLKPGEKKTVKISIAASQLMFYDINMKKVLEPGDFEIMIGASSDDIKYKTIITAK
ncbi:MAG: glycoside hydrolase family 3 C-terminal domain-containing protein [Cytophagales bacterium]|nr:glycoside hydrolase family 3 C-terminal domain-containing protein [Cytophagales bacterium]